MIINVNQIRDKKVLTLIHTCKVKLTTLIGTIKKYAPQDFLLSLIGYIPHCANFDIFMLRSYSQEGEDMILRRVFEAQSKGFYIDVGAHHPKRFSNTFIFYKRGWHGINIDAMPGSMKKFTKRRPRDINLEIPIAKQKKKITYYQFDEPALNGFSEDLALSRSQAGRYKLVSQQEMYSCPLNEILEEHLDKEQEIDFLSIDVEGLDLEVLQSNDWSKFRPKVILVELLRSSLSSLDDDPVCLLLEKESYSLYAKSVNTAFFFSKEFIDEYNMRIRKKFEAD